MSSLVSSHEKADITDSRIFIEPKHIPGYTLYQLEEMKKDENKDTLIDIFNQSLTDTLCHNFDNLISQPISNGNVNFTDDSQIYHLHNKHDFKSEMRKFNKVWPDQLDILAGPLLEDDDDNFYECNILDAVPEANKSSNNTALILDSAMTSGIVQYGTNKKVFHIDSIDCGKKDSSIQISNNDINLGRVIRLSRVDEDNNEEIDILTVDDEIAKDNVQSHQMLNVNINNVNSEKHLIFQKDSGKCLSNEGKKLCSSKNNLKESLLDVKIAQQKDDKETILEAPDLNSLLEKFEATEEFIESEEAEKNKLDSNKSIDSSISKNTVKGALDASVIKRIKSSIIQPRSTIMISPETILKSSSHKAHTNINTKHNRSISTKRNATSNNQASNSVISTNINNVDVFSDIDHDYCSVMPNLNDETYYNKLPDYLTELKPIKTINSPNKVKMKKTLKQTCDDEDIHKKSNIDHHNEIQIDRQCIANDQSFHLIETSKKVPSPVKIMFNSSPMINDISDSKDSENSLMRNLDFNEKSNEKILQPLYQENNLQFNDFINEEDIERRNLSLSLVLRRQFHNDGQKSPDFRNYRLQRYCCSENNSPNRSSPKHIPVRRSRSRSPTRKYRYKNYRERNYLRSKMPVEESIEKIKQTEERRVIYIGDIPENVTYVQLREHFGKFGPIQEIKINFGDHGENYAFITFYNREDAYQAIEHGNDEPCPARFYLSFGGRRQFCKAKYSDLDSQNVNEDRHIHTNTQNLDFDSLLKVVKAQQESKIMFKS